MAATGAGADTKATHVHIMMMMMMNENIDTISTRTNLEKPLHRRSAFFLSFQVFSVAVSTTQEKEREEDKAPEDKATREDGSLIVIGLEVKEERMSAPRYCARRLHHHQHHHQHVSCFLFQAGRRAGRTLTHRERHRHNRNKTLTTRMVFTGMKEEEGGGKGACS